jgi:hypothetical protein
MHPRATLPTVGQLREKPADAAHGQPAAILVRAPEADRLAAFPQIVIDGRLVRAVVLLAFVGHQADIKRVCQYRLDAIFLEWHPPPFVDRRQATRVQLLGQTEIAVIACDG